MAETTDLFTITAEWLHQHSTGENGWTAAQLRMAVRMAQELFESTVKSEVA